MFKINQLRIQNFRGARNISLDDLSTNVAIHGKNGAGKSSILDAIRMALFNFCGHTSKAGQGAADQIEDFNKKATIMISLDVDGKDMIIQMIINKRGANVWGCSDGDGQCIEEITNQAEFWKYTGIDRNHAMVSAFPEAFIDSKDLDDILSEFLSGNIDAADLAEVLKDHEDWFYAFAKAQTIPPDSLTNFQTLGTIAFNQRREFKRELPVAQADVDLYAAARAPRDGNGKTRSSEDIPGIKRGVADCEDEQAALLTEKGAAELYPDVEKTRAELTAEMDDKVEDVRKSLETVTQTKKTLEVKRETGDALSREYTAALSTTDWATRSFEVAEKSLSALQDKESRCPTCLRKYGDELIKKLRDPFMKQLEEGRTEKAESKEEADKIGRALNDARNNITDAQREWELSSEAHTKNKDILSEVCARLAALPENIRPLVDIEADIVEKAEKIARGHAILEDLDKLDKKISSRKHLDYLTSQISELDWVVDQFKNGVAIKALLSVELGMFTHRCSQELNTFGMAMDAEVTGKKVQLLLRVPGKEYRPVKACSDGEKMLAAYAVAMAFSDVGAPVLIDNLNDLDEDKRGLLLAMLCEKTESTIMAAAACKIGIEGCTMIEMADGDVV